MTLRRLRPPPGGFAYVAAVVLLVALATLAITVTRLSTTQQLNMAEDAMQSYALQAARAGTEWGLYRALQDESCAAAERLDLRAQSGGFAVTVRCTSQQYNEGVQADGVTPQVINIYTISAVACNSATACPDDGMATRAGYVERRRVVTLCAAGARAPC